MSLLVNTSAARELRRLAMQAIGALRSSLDFVNAMLERNRDALGKAIPGDHT